MKTVIFFYFKWNIFPFKTLKHTFNGNEGGLSIFSPKNNKSLNLINYQKCDKIFRKKEWLFNILKIVLNATWQAFQENI